MTRNDTNTTATLRNDSIRSAVEASYQGRVDAENGAHADENPYPEGSAAARDWAWAWTQTQGTTHRRLNGHTGRLETVTARPRVRITFNPNTDSFDIA